MTVGEVHNMFRTYAQQQGMQTVRAILPEDIDIYVNTQIVNKVRSVVLENTMTSFNDKVSIQRNAISPINAIRTLYETKQITNISGDGKRLTPYNVNIDFDEEVMFYTGVVVYYPANKSYSCRLIEGESLEDTMNDYCNASAWDTPIADIRHKNSTMIVDIYTDNSNRMPNSVGIRFIKKPARIKFSENGQNDVHPDVPEHIMPDIILTAVNEFFKSVGSTSHNSN